MNKKILLAFDDPGGGLAVSSLIESINKEINSCLIIYAGKLSKRLMNEENSVNAEIRDISSFIGKEEAEEIIKLVKPDILITGTGGGNAEQELRNTAYRNNIKSIVILDFWKDYSRRWKYSDYSFEEMKDKICVMDELTKNEMIFENFKSDNLIVTGHPYLDKIFKRKPEIDLSDNKEYFYRNILFLSQPLEIIGVKDHIIHPLEIFLNSISKLSDETDEKLYVRIKLHPSEEKSVEIMEIAKKFNKGFLEVEILSKENSLIELIKESDIVAGYNTIALFEARALGKRAISLIVAEIRNSLKHAMINAGIEIIEADQESIIECIRIYNAGTTDIEKFSGGIENCMKLIKQELSIN